MRQQCLEMEANLPQNRLESAAHTIHFPGLSRSGCKYWRQLLAELLCNLRMEFDVGLAVRIAHKAQATLYQVFRCCSERTEDE